jgi:uncharacterized protein (TIGR02300 family)
VTKPELGTKRTCNNCGVKFYDLHKDPIVCPKCETVFVPPAAAPVQSYSADRRSKLSRIAPMPEPESTKAPVEKLDGEAFIVPEEQDDDDGVGGTNDEIEKNQET